MAILEIAAGVVAVWAGVEGLRARKARDVLERRIAFYEDRAAIYAKPVDDIRPAFTQGATELCGGCGHMLPPEEIKACMGADCFRYGEQKKIPIGYKGHLHKEPGQGIK
jgi:hypothetical protein